MLIRAATRVNPASGIRTALLAMGLVVLASCGPSGSPSSDATIDWNAIPDVPAKGDRIVDASIGDASNLIPMIAGDAASHAIASQLYLSLLKYDANLDLTGQLAKSWDIAPDNRTIVFHLRPGLRWSDGQPFSSSDCLFTLRLIQDPHTQSAYKTDYAKVTAAEAPDPLTFVVHYDEPFSPALASWASLAILPRHVFEHEDIMHTPLSRSPKATIGPYRLVDWQPQQSILLRANPDYFDGPVWITERLTRIIPDTATQFLELSAGRLDLMTLSPIQYTRLYEKKAILKRDYKRYRYLDFVYTYLGFNLKHPLFHDVRVRRAIAYAIDRQELVDGVLLGLGQVIATPYKPGTFWVNKSLNPRPFAPERARRLLAAAGWKDHDGDGILDKDGRAFQFTLLTNNGNKQRADTAIIIQQRLHEIGIKMDIRLVEWSAFIENFINKHNFEAVILGWSLSPEPDQFAIWHSSQTGPRQFNFLSYSNPVVDSVLEAARRTFDKQQRKRLYDRMQQELFNDVPVVFLYAPYSLPVIHRRIHGIHPAPAGIGYNSEHWYVPKPAQKYHLTEIQP